MTNLNILQNCIEIAQLEAFNYSVARKILHVDETPKETIQREHDYNHGITYQIDDQIIYYINNNKKASIVCDVNEFVLPKIKVSQSGKDIFYQKEIMNDNLNKLQEVYFNYYKSLYIQENKLLFKLCACAKTLGNTITVVGNNLQIKNLIDLIDKIQPNEQACLIISNNLYKDLLLLDSPLLWFESNKRDNAYNMDIIGWFDDIPIYLDNNIPKDTILLFSTKNLIGNLVHYTDIDLDDSLDKDYSGLKEEIGMYIYDNRGIYCLVIDKSNKYISSPSSVVNKQEDFKFKVNGVDVNTTKVSENTYKIDKDISNTMWHYNNTRCSKCGVSKSNFCDDCYNKKQCNCKPAKGWWRKFCDFVQMKP